MRILALDIGKRRIGIAISDPLQITARPHSTIERNKESPQMIASLAKELEVQRILVGLPLHLDGTEGSQAKDVRRFAEKLEPLIPDVPYEFQDERLSSVEAEQRLADRRGSWRKNRKKVDSVAAAVILEDFLKNR